MQRSAFSSAFHLPTALSDFYQNIFMTLSAKYPIACLEQACLGERQEGFEEQMVLKKTSGFFPWFCICAEASSSDSADWLFSVVIS